MPKISVRETSPRLHDQKPYSGVKSVKEAAGAPPSPIPQEEDPDTYFWVSQVEIEMRKQYLIDDPDQPGYRYANPAKTEAQIVNHLKSFRKALAENTPAIDKHVQWVFDWVLKTGCNATLQVVLEELYHLRHNETEKDREDTRVYFEKLFKYFIRKVEFFYFDGSNRVYTRFGVPSKLSLLEGLLRAFPRALPREAFDLMQNNCRFFWDMLNMDVLGEFCEELYDDMYLLNIASCSWPEFKSAVNPERVMSELTKEFCTDQYTFTYPSFEYEGNAHPSWCNSYMLYDLFGCRMMCLYHDLFEKAEWLLDCERSLLPCDALIGIAQDCHPELAEHVFGWLLNLEGACEKIREEKRTRFIDENSPRGQELVRKAIQTIRSVVTNSHAIELLANEDALKSLGEEDLDAQYPRESLPEWVTPEALGSVTYCTEKQVYDVSMRSAKEGDLRVLKYLVANGYRGLRYMELLKTALEHDQLEWVRFFIRCEFADRENNANPNERIVWQRLKTASRLVQEFKHFK